ncbi:MAG: helix-turn-helix domain-containing protein [Nitrospirota bacterium]|nr:helix-turn-helix domain-containing protein [Nitrospirota bacterium]
MFSFLEWPVYSYSLPRPIVARPGYPSNPKSIGEHLRKRRIDLGLFQRQAAEQIGVSEASVYNWERGTEPEIRHMPAIIRFLGYVPFPCPEDTLGRLRYFKMVNGLSFERLGAVMGRDPEQLLDWISRGMRPCKRNIRSINQFLQHNLKNIY